MDWMYSCRGGLKFAPPDILATRISSHLNEHGQPINLSNPHNSTRLPTPDEIRLNVNDITNLTRRGEEATWEV